MAKWRAGVCAAVSAIVLAGPAGAADDRVPQVEAANRKLVLDFYNRVFNAHDVAGGTVAMVDGYRQHNPMIPNGKAAFVAFFTGLFQTYPQFKAQILQVAADGDLVWVHVHLTNSPADRGQAVVDIFRVEDGKLVEHWDVMQPVPDASVSKNAMF